jgi:TonB-linked SusC/RagA family outer membrane protein
MKRLILLLACFFIGMGGVAIAQNTQAASGVVLDETGEPVIGASVVAKGNVAMGTVTDMDGRFVLNVPGSEKTLIIKYLGMQTQEVAAAPNVRVVLLSDVKALEEIVITGYGVTRKVAFTGSAQTVDGKTITKTTDADPIRSLQGSVAGLQMNAETGQPGGYNSVLIRGLGSFNSGTQPLYVIDGVPITTGKQGIRKEEEATINPLSGLNSNDIESISVLKDATATAIYGARAANGVVVITTKSGKSGNTKVNFSAKIGAATLPKRGEYRMLNAAEWYDFQKHLLYNSGFIDELSLEKTKAFAVDPDGLGLDIDPNADTDWYKAVTRSGTTQDYNLDISGGDTKTKFFISGGYYDETGVVIGKDLQRFSGRINVENKISRFVSIGINTFASYQKMNYGAGGGYFSDPLTQSMMQLPVQPIYTKDGSWNMNTVNSYNPVAQRSEKGDKNIAKQYKAIVSPWVKVNFLNDFTFLSKYGMDYYNAKEFGLWSMLQPQGSDMNMMGEEANTYTALWTWTNTLNWMKSFGLQNINVLVGQELQKATMEEAYLAGSNYPGDNVYTVENAATPSQVSTGISNYALSSFFLNAEYDYNSKYYVSGSLRRDGSSRFGVNNKWGTFWSVGAKYRIINELFMESVKDKISNLTLRTSYGTTGNQDIDDWYKARGLYGFGYNYLKKPGMIPTQIANPDLRWEQTAKFNVGVELGLFNKISVDLEYYNNRTTDMLFEVPITMATGFATTMLNVGEMKNAGVEATVNYNAISNTDLQWDLSFNITHNKNEIVKLSTDQPIEDTYTIREVGRPYNTFKMKEYAGVDPETGKQLWYKGETGKETTDDYNEAGKRYLGEADPKVYGGFSSNLKWHDFDFSFLLNYSLGGKVYNSAARYDENINNPFGNTTEYVYKNMWKNPGDITQVPKPLYGSINSHSSRFLMDGSYIKLQNIQLGYNLPHDLVKQAKLAGVRLYVSGENLKTWALDKDFRGASPETGPDGVLWWNYPLSRKVMFGLNINF